MLQVQNKIFSKKPRNDTRRRQRRRRRREEDDNNRIISIAALNRANSSFSTFWNFYVFSVMLYIDLNLKDK